MRFTAVIALGALASVATMTTAAADPYGAIIGGVTFLGPIPTEVDLNINPTCNTTQGTCDRVNIGAGPGFRIGAAFGVAPNEDIAFELETIFTRVRLRTFQVMDPPPFGPGPENPGPVTPIGGPGPSTANQITLMGNTIISMPGNGPLFYLGFGAGAATVGLNVPAGAIGADEAVDRDWAAAFQFFTGFNWETEGGQLVGIRYRLQHVGFMAFEDGGGDPIRILPHNVHGLELVVTFGR